MSAAPAWLRVFGLVAAILSAIAVTSGQAVAHTGGTTGHATVTVSGQSVRYSLSLTADALARAGMAADNGQLAAAIGRHVSIAADGRDCAPVPGATSGGGATVRIEVLYACAAPVRVLAVRDGLDRLIGADHHTITDIAWPDGRHQVLFEGEHRAFRIDLSGGTGAAGAMAADQAAGGFVAYLGLGVEHILLGFDHVLFVVALILQGGSLLSALAIVSAFTLAHSITLVLSVLDVVSTPGRIVEPVIALSIAYVAAENVFRRDRAVSRRWAVGFVFGLVHGFGFAGALREVGLPAEGLASVLLGFNLGVEAGQALIVAALVPVLMWFRRFPWQGRLVRTSSVAILAAGILLLVERAFLGGA